MKLCAELWDADIKVNNLSCWSGVSACTGCLTDCSQPLLFVSPACDCLTCCAPCQFVMLYHVQFSKNKNLDDELEMIVLVMITGNCFGSVRVTY